MEDRIASLGAAPADETPRAEIPVHEIPVVEVPVNEFPVAEVLMDEALMDSPQLDEVEEIVADEAVVTAAKSGWVPEEIAQLAEPEFFVEEQPIEEQLPAAEEMPVEETLPIDEPQSIDEALLLKELQPVEEPQAEMAASEPPAPVIMPSRPGLAERVQNTFTRQQQLILGALLAMTLVVLAAFVFLLVTSY
ncbi:hypothetical protein EHM76_01425 [bacterium]|nr:MAG: hypothetical protein EHM76_01425 [bacterium]